MKHICFAVLLALLALPTLAADAQLYCYKSKMREDHARTEDSGMSSVRVLYSTPSGGAIECSAVGTLQGLALEKWPDGEIASPVTTFIRVVEKNTHYKEISIFRWVVE